MIDTDGFRANVGIILSDDRGRVFWARRVGRSGWQFPQGGVRENENPDDAMFRELHEEVGIERTQVDVLGATRRWLRYRLPEQYLRHHSQPLCIGQKQRWYLLRFKGSESDFRFDVGETPEFDRWRWVDYWTPAEEVIFFKRRVYRQALRELAPLLFGADDPRRAPAANDR